jgi:phosphonate transport system ATP-binding protein
MLEVTRVQMIYPGGCAALKEIGFSVSRGEFVAVVGPSGCGKSTLLNCLNRTLSPTKGRIVFQGEDLLSLSPHCLQQTRRRIGVVYQDFNLIRRYSALTNVLTGALAECGPFRPVLGLWPAELKERALRKLEIVGIRDKALARVETLSGGQQQRVAIARSLMQEPELILADEPVASLDPKSSALVMKYLRGINRELSLTIVCTLHSVRLARSHADRIIAMKDGEIVFNGTPDTFDSSIEEMVYS